MRNLAIAGVGLLLALGGTGVARAQSAGAFMTNPAFSGPKPARCDSTYEMQHCAAHDLRVADRAMSAAYAAARSRSSASARSRLLTEQRRWLRTRDSGCVAKGRRYDGGSMRPVVVAQCWVEVTRARTRALGAWRR
ncbi:MAG: lysozyme inhibitor LprI family protein [Sphingomonas sp.]